MATLPISVQLYTLRDLTAGDMPGTLKEVAAIGFKYVELAGFGSLSSAGAVRRALDEAGLEPSGAHIAIEVLEKELDKALDEQEQIGNKVVVVPWLNEDRRRDAAGYRQAAASLAKIAAAAGRRGFDLAYHNHDFEFKQFDGQTGLDILFGATDPNQVKSELDVYWVKRGGIDPVSCIRKLGSRLLTLHLKDVARGSEPKFAEVGTGTLDFPAIVAAGVQAGAKFGVVEQDDTYGTPPLQAVRTSYENLARMGLIR